jgi:hypothetical protein
LFSPGCLGLGIKCESGIAKPEVLGAFLIAINIQFILIIVVVTSLAQLQFPKKYRPEFRLNNPNLPFQTANDTSR